MFLTLTSTTFITMQITRTTANMLLCKILFNAPKLWSNTNSSKKMLNHQVPLNPHLRMAFLLKELLTALKKTFFLALRSKDSKPTERAKPILKFLLVLYWTAESHTLQLVSRDHKGIKIRDSIKLTVKYFKRFRILAYLILKKSTLSTLQPSKNP